MKIVQLTAENVKRLVAVNIKPDGNLVVIGGKNGAGKTSVLDSIMYALGGKGAVPAKPIRDGEKKATITVELDDMTVTRTFTATGSTIKVTNAKGLAYPSPQTMLDKLVGRLSFDPLDFTRMKPGEQSATLRDLVGIDHSELEAKRANAYAERTNVNRDLKRLQAAASEMTEPGDDTPAEPVAIKDILDELEVAQAKNRERHGAFALVGDVSKEIGRIDDLIITNDREIESLRRQLTNAEKYADDLKSERTKAQESRDTLQAEADAMPEIECDPIHERLKNVEAINAKVSKAKDWHRLQSQMLDAEQESEALTAIIEAVDDKKADDLKAAPFPVEGLAFDESGVLFNGIPFNQSSMAEQLRVSVAIGLAMNPDLRVVLIRDASLMDADTLATVGEMAAEKDAQLWLERVGDGDECSVVIEDGAVREPAAVTA